MQLTLPALIRFFQFTHYVRLYPDDKLFVKLSVVGLMIITTLKSIQSLYVKVIYRISILLLTPRQCVDLDSKYSVLQ